ncbi:MAG: quinohemoprotein amine dehydrogenase subunit alpha [Azoarcus sp.]|nr:quinohemoprotein amine dehydrogenase subunit alpha [Azoarcus sp.]
MGINSRSHGKGRWLVPAMALIAPFIVSSAAAASAKAEALVSAKCGTCHAASEPGKWDRISDSRRTPEGWDMTVARMTYAHGVVLSGTERRDIVKYLADEHGLAPQETASYRYILDRSPSVIEHFEDEEIGQTCARCHSYGRIAVQRRTEGEWRKLVHFHVGQYPAIEIQAGGRDRNWFEIASGDVSQRLGKVYGLQSEAWKSWKETKHASPQGKWRLVGHRPGWGGYEGTATVSPGGDDTYRVDMRIKYANGKVENAKGSSILYAGHEWRAKLRQGDKDILQVFSLKEGGRELAGRWFEEGNDAIGGDFKAVRADGGTPVILSVQPAMARAGAKETLTINGVGLKGEVSLGPDVVVSKVVSRTLEQLVVEVEVARDAETGVRTVSLDGVSSDGALKVYRSIDLVKIVPAHPMARVGDGGGKLPKVPAQLEAVAYAAGADGKPGTDDDLRLGVVDAKWGLANLNEAAEKMRDLDFAGRIEPNGLFLPNEAGPNPKRVFSANNAGELLVTAAVQDGDRTVSAQAPLIVTVQRWNDPPIR